MRNIMLDIETLDIKESSVVLSIGAVKFDEVALGEKFHITMDINDQVKHGRTMDPETIKWWMKQSDGARQAVILDGVSPYIALMNLRDFIGTERFKVWGNGAMFDNSIVISLFRTYGVQLPWTYKDDRCYRTVLAEHMERDPSFLKETPKCAHNALDDAIAQARTLQNIWVSSL